MGSFFSFITVKFLGLFFHRKKVTVFDIFFSYRLILKRLPDLQGWSHYMRQKRESGLSLESLTDTFLRSPEFLRKEGSSREGTDPLNYETLPIEEEVVALPDFRIIIDKNDQFIGKAIKRDNCYEPYVTRVINAILKPEQTFVDIGANIGYFSLLASRRVGPRGRVIAFEPMAQNFSLLLRSIQLNGFQNIEPHAIALSNENKIVKMILWERRNSGSFHLLNDPHWNREIYSVQARRLDDLLEGKRADLIKIDVEGAEGLVFQGMSDTLRKHQPIVIMEYTPLGLRDISKIPGEELLRAFESLYYSFQDVESFDGKLCGKPVQQLEDLLRRRKTGHLDLILFPRSIAGLLKGKAGGQ